MKYNFDKTTYRNFNSLNSCRKCIRRSWKWKNTYRFFLLHITEYKKYFCTFFLIICDKYNKRNYRCNFHACNNYFQNQNKKHPIELLCSVGYFLFSQRFTYKTKIVAKNFSFVVVITKGKNHRLCGSERRWKNESQTIRNS